MCCILNSNKIKPNCELYDDVRSQIRPFDAIFFKNNTICSNVIACTQKF